MLDAVTVSFLEGGCALIVGTVGADGAPYATRGWGATAIGGPGASAGAPGLRLLLAADDDRAIADLGPGAPIAVTGADVPTLRSVQVKGRAVGIEPAGDADRARMAAYCDEFFGDIERNDGTPRVLPDRLVPADVVVVTVEVDAVFDQTPGPAAGRAVGAGPT